MADEKGTAEVHGDPVRRVAVYSLLLNIGLVGTKLVLSQISGSLSLRADAVQSMVDVFASLALILGLIISSRKSKDFPYGLYKVENVVSVVISIPAISDRLRDRRCRRQGRDGPALLSGMAVGGCGSACSRPFHLRKISGSCR